MFTTCLTCRRYFHEKRIRAAVPLSTLQRDNTAEAAKRDMATLPVSWLAELPDLLAFPKKPVLKTAQILQNRGLVSKALGSALSKVMAENWATVSLQAILPSEGNVWEFVEVRFERKCIRWGWEGKSTFSTRLDEERANPVLFRLGRGYRETSFWRVHFSGDMIWRSATCEQCSGLFPLLGPSLAWSYTGRNRDTDSPGVPDSLLPTKAVGGPGPAASLLVHHHPWPSSCAEVLGRAEVSMRILGSKISFTLYLDKLLFDIAQVTWSVPCFPQQKPLLPWAGVQFRMATVTLTAEIAAQIIGQQCNYNSTTPHFNVHIKVVTSTCSLPSAIKKKTNFWPSGWIQSPNSLFFHSHGSW